MNLNLPNNRTILAPFIRLATCTVALVGLSAVLAVSARATDPIGTASAITISCPPGGAANGKCARVKISGCAGGTFYADAKLNKPTCTPIGAVILTTGGGGNAWYDTAFQLANNCPSGNCGKQAILDLNAAGYDTIQTNFSDTNNQGADFDGWLTGLTTTQIGPRELACRYATIANWVWTAVLQKSSTPVCATGNSAGSAAIAYSISQYGLGTSPSTNVVFKMVELTSGPPLSRLDHGCLPQSVAAAPQVQCPMTNPPTTITEAIGMSDAEKFVDPSYDGDLDCGTSCSPDGQFDYCGNSINAGSTTGTPLLHDSILSDTDPPTLNYSTNVKVVFGSADLTAAVPLGQEWLDAVTSTKSQGCVQGATHPLPEWQQGEQRIVTDIKSLCK
jgi:hypothetical protein